MVAETPWGGLGLSVCYDLRFPQLYAGWRIRRDDARGPAAFTKLTGEAHWHVLVRARAIENGAYVFAPCQNGTWKAVELSVLDIRSSSIRGAGCLPTAGKRKASILADIDPRK